MSVILDALKRVQDENRRRAGGSAEPPRRDPESPNALLRRLSEPAEETPDAPARRVISPVILASLAGVAAVALVAAALWYFQPTFNGPQANDGRPLLDLSARRSSADGSALAGVAQPSSAIQERFGAGSGGGLEGAGGVPEAAGPEGREGEDPAGADMSDLSGGLSQAERGAGDDAGAAATAAASSDDSVLKLEVETRPRQEAAPVSPRTQPRDDPFVDIRSARPGGDPTAGASGAPVEVVQQPWQPPTRTDTLREEAPAESAGATVPRPLVDPGVRAAFAEGVRLQKAGDQSGAEDAYKRALQRDPDNARVNANLGVLYESQDRLTLAERHLRAAVAVEPDNGPAHNNLGVVLYRLGTYEAALIEFNRTLALDPRNLDAYTNKGLIYTRWGQYEEAERAFMQVLTIDPTNPLAHYNLGLVYEEMGKLDRAVDHYYEFVRVGGAGYPEIASYLDRHLRWLEGRLRDGAGPTR